MERIGNFEKPKDIDISNKECDDLHELTIDEIRNILKNMVVDNINVMPVRYFSFMVKNNDGETEYKIIRNALVAIAITDPSIKARNYNSPAILDKIQEFIDIYGPIYKIY